MAFYLHILLHLVLCKVQSFRVELNIVYLKSVANILFSLLKVFTVQYLMIYLNYMN